MLTLNYKNYRAFKKVCVNSIKKDLLDNNANKNKCKNLQKQGGFYYGKSIKGIIKKLCKRTEF